MENLAGDVEEGIDEDVAKSLEDASSVDAGTIDVATSVATATIDGTEEPAVMGLLLHEQSEAENGEEHCLDVELAISADVDSATIAGIQSSRLDSGPPTVVVTSHMGESNITVVDEKSGLHSMDQDADGSDQEVEQDMSMEDDSQPETVLESGRSESGAEGYSENVQPVLELMSTGTTLVSGSHLMQAVSLPDIQGLQTVTLADGTTVLVQQSQVKGVKQDQNMQLEEGVTAIVQEVPEDSKANITKMLEGQTIELEDGTTAFIQADPKITDSLQAVQLEDGTTAYLSGFMNSDRILDNSNLNVEQLNAQVHQAIAGHSVHVSSGQLYLKTTGSSVKTSAGSTISALPSSPRVPSDRALSLGDKAYRCQYEGCGRLYTTQHHLKVHERYHTGDRPYKCDFGDCEKAFATGYGLKSHTRVHTGEKPYKCPEDTCLKSFKTSGDLQKHIRTHTGERPFKCPFEGCDRSFTTSNIRKVHIRTHTGERPYVCTEAGCNKTFASATNFKNHARIHTGEKPYVCTVQGCGKRFTEYSSLYKHHVVHTHSKPYECCTCGKTYRQTSTLAMHKRTTHGEDVSAEMEAALVMPADVTEIANKNSKFRNSFLIYLFNDTKPLYIESGDGDHAKHSGLGLPGHDENEGTLIINTSTGQQMNLVNAAGVGMAADAQTVAAIQHAAQHGIQGTLPPGQPGILAEVGGHQIFVVTDPMILEPLQQIAQNQTGQNVEIIPTVQDVPVDTMINNRQ